MNTLPAKCLKFPRDSNQPKIEIKSSIVDCQTEFVERRENTMWIFVVWKLVEILLGTTHLLPENYSKKAFTGPNKHYYINNHSVIT